MTKTKVFKWLAVALIILLSALSFYIFGDDSQVLFANASANEKPLRLHVLANSDSIEDQQLKLQVRDFIITLLKPQLADIENKEAAMNLIEANIPQLTEACNAFLNGKADYQATLALERADFPEINYDGMVFASGEYDALRIILGEGEGKNWWCVLFPP
ncbi:MAG: stage II sporulation protein R, partial [Firmicutes bacterium]|nr:stage II sporulation protein R [Bacillota bacterium]